MAERIRTENARSIDGTSLTGTFQNIGAATTAPAKVVMIYNGCNKQVLVSWDGGATTGFDLPPSSGASVDCGINSERINSSPNLPIGSQFQGKHDGVVPTSGKITITVVY